MDDAALLADLVELIVKHLVERPEEVGSSAETHGDRIKILVSVAEGEQGRVIGKDGRTIHAIRQIAMMAAARRGRRVTVDLAKEPSDG